MKALSLFGLLSGFAFATAVATPVDETLARFSQRFQDANPSADQLAIWQLDWEDTLAAAMERAKAERRPVLFILVTNISGPSNFGSGHC